MVISLELQRGWEVPGDLDRSCMCVASALFDLVMFLLEVALGQLLGIKGREPKI